MTQQKKSAKSILFVEDHLGLIDELVEILLYEMDPDDLDIQFAPDINTAMDLCEHQKFDVIVLDTMLPAIPGVPEHDEGIYFVSWIFGALEGLPPWLKKQKRASWMNSKNYMVAFLTSRDTEPVKEELEKLTEGDYSHRIVMIERLSRNVIEQYEIILKCLEGGAAHDKAEA